LKDDTKMGYITLKNQTKKENQGEKLENGGHLRCARLPMLGYFFS